MADTTDIRKGFKIVLEGQPYVFIEHQFVKPGKGQAFIRSRLRNMITGNVIDRTFKSGEKLDKADTEDRTMQYLYAEGDARVFMDTTNYEQVTISDQQLGETVYYLLDGTQVDVVFFQGRPIGVTPPTFVELVVTETEPGFKGDTTSNVMKPATMETGLQVQVPLFVEVGEKLKIDTRTGEYVERVKG
ncbi:MAG: elongation factor P [Myxococcales bacterium]|jgi:elongation factor P|nr:elongation factor P [Myxococcales bacterium]